MDREKEIRNIVNSALSKSAGLKSSGINGAEVVNDDEFESVFVNTTDGCEYRVSVVKTYAPAV